MAGVVCLLAAALLAGCASALPPGMDCGILNLTFAKAAVVLGSPSPSVFDALQLAACGIPRPPDGTPLSPHEAGCRLPSDVSHSTLHVSPKGSDTTGDGSVAAPYASLYRARDARRGLASGVRVDVLLHHGVHFLRSPLVLGPHDANTRYVACEGSQAVVTGAVRYDNVAFMDPKDPSPLPPAARGKVKVARIDKGLAADQLFAVPDGEAIGTRLVWAREPNGNAETDLQPKGYAMADGNPKGTFPVPPGAKPVEGIFVPSPTRNSTYYPYFGRDLDPRGAAVWLHSGGEAAVYQGSREFWNQSIARGLRWNTTGGGRFHQPGFNATGWPTRPHPPPVLHAMHQSEWGNHVWEVEEVDIDRRTFTFSRGGWQEGRYVSVGTNPFYVEGVQAALDTPGEWWYDPLEGELWLWPNSSVPPKTVAIPVNAVLVDVAETSDITVEGVVFTQTSRTLLEQYSVPSPGDWSVHQGGVVTVSNSSRVNITRCAFNRTGGNGVAFLGSVRNSQIHKCDFDLIGDSAVVMVGSLPGMGNSAVRGGWFPADNAVTHNHIRSIGVWGKQVSALFQAVTCRTLFSFNVAYNGPRAAVNINDGFCGGTRVEDNVLFNWVRETQDHGPINTWDRACYIHPDGGVTPQWNRVVRNVIVNGPSPNRDLGNLFPAVDNDDGSAYYWIADNLVAYGGFKNFLGHDKAWTGNVILYPSGRTEGSGNGQCIMAWAGGGNVYTNNTCVTRLGSPVGVDPYPVKGPCSYATQRSILVHLAQNTYYTATGEYSGVCGGDLSALQREGVEVGSTVAPVPPTSYVLQLAREKAGLR